MGADGKGDSWWSWFSTNIVPFFSQGKEFVTAASTTIIKTAGVIGCSAISIVGAGISSGIAQAVATSVLKLAVPIAYTTGAVVTGGMIGVVGAVGVYYIATST